MIFFYSIFFGKKFLSKTKSQKYSLVKVHKKMELFGIIMNDEIKLIILLKKKKEQNVCE